MAISLLFSFPAQGAEGATTIEEVVVTARHRQESLQDVPLSETVFTKQHIEDARIDHVADFIALTPNIALREATDFGGSSITIRGLTQVRNIESPVAVRVDGIQQVNTAQFTQELFDIESIEVLRGPQGAIYGRNATGGAIIIKTKDPSNELSGKVNVRLGKNDERKLQGSISLPVVEDTLFFRAGFSTQKRDGYVKNTFLDEYLDPYDDDTFRGMMKWVVNEHLEVDVHATIARTKTGANNWFYNIVPAEADFVDFENVARVIGRMDRDLEDVALKIEYDATFATLTSITTYSRVESHQAQKGWPYGPTTAGPTFIDFADNDGDQNNLYQDVDTVSQEFRLASNNDGGGRLQWLGGFFLLNTDRFVTNASGPDTGGEIPFVERTPLPGSTGFLAANNENKAWSAFVNLDYDIRDDLTLSLAYRYDEDKITQTVSPLQIGGIPGLVSKVKFTKGQPKFSLRYKPTDNVNLYTSWGVGFRSGGFNQQGLAARLVGSGLVGVQDIVRPETSKTFEFGAKTDWLDGRLRLNAAVFSTQLEDSYYFIFEAGTGEDILFNIDEIDLLGFEIELTAKINENLDFYASYGYTDSEIKRFDIEQRIGPEFQTIGNKAPHVPEDSINIGVQYRTPIMNNIGLFLRADHEVLGKQYWDPYNTTSRSRVDLLTLRAGIEDLDGRWSVIATVENALDKTYNREYFPGHPFDEGYGWFANPIVWGVDFSYNF